MKLKPLRPQSNELLHLDTMRFIAAAGIVLGHSRSFFYSPADRTLAVMHSGGLALFVDLFFAISGYVIAYVYADRITDLHSFLIFIQRRIGRLGPLHWLTFALSVGLWGSLALFQVPAQHAPSFKAACLIETVTLTHALYSCDGLIHNGQSWSISAEMAMYICFPLLLTMGRRSPIYLIMIAGGSAAAIIGLIYANTDAATTADAWGSVYAPLRAAVSFCIGVALWLMRSTVARFPAPEIVLYVSVPALFVMMLTTSSAMLTMSLVYIVVVSAVSADLKGTPGPVFRGLSPLGQLTYSIYMWHGLFILVFINILGDKALHASGWPMICIAMLTYFLILIWSYLSFSYIETPARRWIDGLQFAPSATSIHKSRV